MAAKWGKKGKQADKRPVKVGASPERISNRLDRLLIAEDKSPRLIRTIRSKQVLIGFALFTLIATGFLLKLTIFNKKSEPKKTYAGICKSGSGIFQEAAVNIYNSDYKKSKETIDKILTDQEYHNSLNCLTALIEYSLMEANSTKAEEYLAVLNKIAPEDQKLDPAYGVIGVKTVSDVKKHVEKAVKVREKMYESVLTF